MAMLSAIIFALSNIPFFSRCAAYRIKVQDLTKPSLEADDSLGLDADSEFIKSLYGSMKCDDSEREEFKKFFGVLPSSSLSTDIWSSARPLKSNPDPEVQKKVIYIYPAHDHNGAFSMNDHMCYRLLSLARLHPDTKLVHVNTVDEAHALLDNTPDNSVKHLVVGGHGSPTSLSFGGCTSIKCRLKVYTPTAMAFFKLAKQKLTSDGRVFLDSCLNGKEGEEHNMAMYVSQLMQGHRVFSSRISFGATNFVVTDFKQFDLKIISDKDEDKNKLDSERNWINVQNCQAWPDTWKDTDGRDCKAFQEGALCSTLGGSAQSESGVTANQACCQCGGGRTTGFTPTGCPHFSEELPENQCQCKDEDALCYQNGKVGCHWNKKPRVFSVFDSSNVECRKPDSCPAHAHASYFSQYDQTCSCPSGWECFQNGKTSPGCPGKDKVELKKFKADCDDCQCKPTNHPTVDCSGGLCKCPSAMKCYNGDTEGCPTQPDYAALAAQGPISTSTTEYTETCEFCNCRLLCKGAAQNQAGKEFAKKLSSPDGQCQCGTSSQCVHGKAKSVQMFKSWGLSDWTLKKVKDGVEAGHVGDCPWPNTQMLGDKYIDMFACPDCYCAYSGTSGAPTEKGSKCQTGWELNGKKCERTDGCCNIDNDKSGPWCPTVDPEIGIGSFGDGSFRYDRCTAVDPEPTAVWVENDEKVCKLDSNKKCGIGQYVYTYRCGHSGNTMIPETEDECFKFAGKPKPKAKDSCYECSDCAFNNPAGHDGCADFCKDTKHCQYGSCSKCAFCFDLEQMCAAL